LISFKEEPWGLPQGSSLQCAVYPKLTGIQADAVGELHTCDKRWFINSIQGL